MSNEFFYIDENGKKSDAALHEDVLAEDDAAAAFAGSTYVLLKRDGLTDEKIRETFTALYDEVIARGLKPA